MKEIGILIKEVVERQGHSIGWLSRQLSCDRSNVYRLFQRDNIDTVTLTRLCRILKHDFFQDLSQELQEHASHGTAPAGAADPVGAVGAVGSGSNAERSREDF